MITDQEMKKLHATVRADELYAAIDAIMRNRDRVLTLLKNHDATVGDNATRRDCAAFHARLGELNLGWLIDRVEKMAIPPASDW